MYSEQKARNMGAPVLRIEPGIQDEEVDGMAGFLMTTEFDKIAATEKAEDDWAGDGPVFVERKRRLRNLLMTLGGTFRQKLLSDDSERRVFSVAISDAPAEDVVCVFDLGVKHGYFQKSTIGNKDGTGRTTLYILTRRVAPYFKLDPSGFAGYLFVTNDRLREGMVWPARLLRRVKSKGVDEAFGALAQQRLFE